MNKDLSTSLAAKLHLAPGTDRIARRPEQVLFLVGTDGDELIRAFLDAETDATAAVCGAAVAVAFAVPSFAIIDWRAEPRITVFGDVQVTTDLPSAPMISGSASRTWVEHVLRPFGSGSDSLGAVSISINADSVDTLTELGSGVVHAGGLQVNLAGEDAVVAPAPPAAAPEIARDDQVGLVDRDDNDQASSDDQASSNNPDSNDEPASPVLDIEPTSGTDDALPGLGSGAQVTPLFGDPVRTPSPAGASSDLVDHDIVATEAQRLQFDSGLEVELDKPVLIGRKPDPARLEPADVGHLDTLAIDDKKLSRNHLIVRDELGEVTITDCGSLNGTVVISHAGATPRRIEAHEVVVLTPDTVVHLGDEVARLTS